MPKVNLRSCKAKKYYYNSKKELSLGNSFWCGDIKNRFKKINNGKKYIYDFLLKGHWSKSPKTGFSWPAAKRYCRGLGKGWSLPNIYQLLSLFGSRENKSEGYINPIFSDTDTFYFWSITPRAASASNAWVVGFSNRHIGPIGVSNYLRVRCFRPGP